MDLEMWIEYLRNIRGMNGIVMAMREWGRLYSRVSVGLGFEELLNPIDEWAFCVTPSIPSMYLYEFISNALRLNDETKMRNGEIKLEKLVRFLRSKKNMYQKIYANEYSN